MEDRIPLERLRTAAREVGEAIGARLVVLFGSTARRNASPMDLDIGVLPGSPGKALDMVDLTNRFTRALDLAEIDVADLGRADPLLCMLVARDGIPLYEATPAEFHRFVSLAARRYADTRKFRSMERRQIQEFIDRSGIPS
ncbi:MAG: nucleotidyltransferase domain-containing protein [Gemmatimonadetes bacterium]|nr:nucleotidyltransferase domain-containing protein [Gemmatimonadota bacterium]